MDIIYDCSRGLQWWGHSPYWWGIMKKQEIARSIDLSLGASLGGKPACLCSSTLLKSRVQLPTALPSVPVVLPLATGACFPHKRLQDCHTQSVAWPIQSQEWVSVSIISLFLWVPSKGHQSWPNHFPSLPIWLLGSFLQFGYTGVLLPVSS